MLIFNNLSDLGLLILRLILGIIFFHHGFPKLKNAAAMAKSMGKSTAFVFILGLVEILSSIVIILGFLTEIGAIGLSIVMFGALYYKLFKWKIPFSAYDKLGWEFDFILLAAALALLFIGAGNISLDAILNRWP